MSCKILNHLHPAPILAPRRAGTPESLLQCSLGTTAASWTSFQGTSCVFSLNDTDNFLKWYWRFRWGGSTDSHRWRLIHVSYLGTMTPRAAFGVIPYSYIMLVLETLLCFATATTCKEDRIFISCMCLAVATKPRGAILLAPMGSWLGQSSKAWHPKQSLGTTTVIHVAG